MNRAARKFLKAGSVGQQDQSELAAACGRIVLLEAQRSLDKALPLAKRFVKNARSHGHPLLSTAYRALGWVQLDRGKYAESAKQYLKARELLIREPLMRARVDRTLIDVYMHLSDLPEARRRARLAMATSDRAAMPTSPQGPHWRAKEVGWPRLRRCFISPSTAALAAA